MTYLQELMAAHRARVERLNRRAPAAGPLVLKPRPRIIRLDRYGDRIVDAPKPALPNFPPLPASPKMPVPLIPSSHVSIAQIVHAVAGEFGLSVATLMDKSTRLHHISRPRQVAMYVARTMIPGISWPTIGRRMGGFDHTTILHGNRAVARRLAEDAELASKVAAIKATLEAVAR